MIYFPKIIDRVINIVVVDSTKIKDRVINIVLSKLQKKNKKKI